MQDLIKAGGCMSMAMCWGCVKFEKGETQSSQSVRNSLRKSEQSKSDWSQFAAGAVDVKSAVMHSESAQVATCLNYHRYPYYGKIQITGYFLLPKKW